jgi:hemolysin activation/secretion protein
LLYARTRVTALGAEITRDKIAISQVGLRGQHQSPLGQTTGQLFVTAGLPVFGALSQETPNPSVAGFDPNFSKISWQLEHILPVNTRLSIFTRMVGQWTDDRLLAGEQVAFGGQILGRGYSPSALTGDRGLGLLGELRLDLPEAARPGIISNVQAYAFTDAASATLLAGRDTPSEKQDIYSFGIGAKAFLLDRLFVDLQFASEGTRLAGGESRPARMNISIVSVF